LEHSCCSARLFRRGKPQRNTHTVRRGADSARPRGTMPSVDGGGGSLQPLRSATGEGQLIARLKLLPAKIIKRWFYGGLWGLSVNAGLIAGAGGAYLILLAADALVFGWLPDEFDEMFIKAAWVWMPLGWWFSCATLMQEEEREGLAPSASPSASRH